MYETTVDPPIQVFGLTSDAAHFTTPPKSHRHNEVELILVTGGSLVFLFGGTKHFLQPGESGVFWAVVPHQVLESDEDAVLYWMKVPLGQFLEWRLPEALVREILHGNLVMDPEAPSESYLRTLFFGWKNWLTSAPDEGKSIVLLQTEARLRETALHLRLTNGLMPSRLENNLEPSRADRMISHIAEHFQDPLSIEDVAAAGGMQPSYAMRLFRARFGMSIVSCINQMRVSLAQRLLVTTELTVLDILLEAGFGSVTQFYTLFKRYCGTPPQEYRRATRH
jgi:AraC-like DNA-binding protein